MNYKEFFEQDEFKKYVKYSSNAKMLEVYDFLTMPEKINEMIRACENGRPALEGIVKELEAKFLPTADFDIENDKFLKQAIGSLIKYIISFFGYEVNIQKNISNPGYFKSATHYKYNPLKAAKKIVATYEILER